MAIISYSATTVGGKLTAEVVSRLKSCVDDLSMLKEMLDQASAGGASPSSLEGHPLFGVGTGQGSAFYDTIVSLKSAVSESTVSDNTLASLYQGD